MNVLSSSLELRKCSHISISSCDTLFLKLSEHGTVPDLIGPILSVLVLFGEPFVEGSVCGHGQHQNLHITVLVLFCHVVLIVMEEELQTG